VGSSLLPQGQTELSRTPQKGHATHCDWTSLVHAGQFMNSIGKLPSTLIRECLSVKHRTAFFLKAGWPTPSRRMIPNPEPLAEKQPRYWVLIQFHAFGVGHLTCLGPNVSNFTSIR